MRARDSALVHLPHLSSHYYPQVVVKREEVSIIISEFAQSCQAWLNISYTSPFSSPSLLSPLSLYKKDPPRFSFEQGGQRERTEGDTDGAAYPFPSLSSLVSL